MILEVMECYPDWGCTMIDECFSWPEARKTIDRHRNRYKLEDVLEGKVYWMVRNQMTDQEWTF